MGRLLFWVHPRFSVFSGPPVPTRSHRVIGFAGPHIPHPAIAMDALQKRPHGILTLEAPPGPCTGASVLILDPLDWIQPITAHIPGPRHHTRRRYGAYCNRSRVTARALEDDGCRTAQARAADQDSDYAAEARRPWGRSLREILQIDQPFCSCGPKMGRISMITDPRIVNPILRHLQSERCRARDPFESRAPPRRRHSRINNSWLIRQL